MSRKGAFVYQQIEMTTEEWAVNTNVYPASVWLFERLDGGKFNMKLSDGIHSFIELPSVMQDVTVTEKTNTDVEYVLEIETAAGVITTPNLRGKNGEKYDDSAVHASIATINSRIDTLLGGSASEAIDTFREIEAFLAGVTDVQTLTGLLADLKAEVKALIPMKTSQLQNDDHTVKDANYVHTDNNFTAADKKKLDRIGSKTTATSVANLDVNYETIQVTLSANASLSANLTGTAYDGWETHVFVHASGADRTIAIPTTGAYISMCGSSYTCSVNKWVEFSLKCIGGIWHIAKLEQE